MPRIIREPIAGRNLCSLIESMYYYLIQEIIDIDKIVDVIAGRLSIKSIYVSKIKITELDSSPRISICYCINNSYEITESIFCYESISELRFLSEIEYLYRDICIADELARKFINVVKAHKRYNTHAKPVVGYEVKEDENGFLDIIEMYP